MVSTFGRNLARLFRSGAGGEMMAVPTVAVMAATAVVTFALSRSVTFAFVMCAVSLPLQLMALANEFLGTCLAVAGSGLVGVSTALIAAALSSGAVGGLGIELGLQLADQPFELVEPLLHGLDVGRCIGSLCLAECEDRRQRCGDEGRAWHGVFPGICGLVGGLRR